MDTLFITWINRLFVFVANNYCIFQHNLSNVDTAPAGKKHVWKFLLELSWGEFLRCLAVGDLLRSLLQSVTDLALVHPNFI